MNRILCVKNIMFKIVFFSFSYLAFFNVSIKCVKDAQNDEKCLKIVHAFSRICC